MAAHGGWIVRNMLAKASSRSFMPICCSFRFYSIKPPPTLTGHKFRQKRPLPPDQPPSLEQKLAALNPTDPELDTPVNIGMSFMPVSQSRRDLYKTARDNRRNKDLERAARLRQLKIPEDKVKEDWLQESAPYDKRAVAEHYGIYQHLFGNATFLPVVNLNVCYDYDEEYVTPVYTGNQLTPTEAKTLPHVDYESDVKTLWSLILTNPDGHLTDNQAEYVHWFVGNIPGNDISLGESLCDYLQPFPAKGTGYHRYVFILYKQDGYIDYSKEKRSPNCNSLKERTFRTVDFYREHQDHLTPVGLSFFQSEWDESVRSIYHNFLDMREPTFEYIHPPTYISPLKKYPHRRPFNEYYDHYRDKKDIAEQVLKVKLKMISPFKQYERPKYPIIHRPKCYRPSWLKQQDELMHRRQAQWKDLP